MSSNAGRGLNRPTNYCEAARIVVGEQMLLVHSDVGVFRTRKPCCGTEFGFHYPTGNTHEPVTDRVATVAGGVHVGSLRHPLLIL
jgi:hypothetical protein